jgi:hypothetical protein
MQILRQSTTNHRRPNIRCLTTTRPTHHENPLVSPRRVFSQPRPPANILGSPQTSRLPTTAPASFQRDEATYSEREEGSRCREWKRRRGQEHHCRYVQTKRSVRLCNALLRVLIVNLAFALALRQDGGGRRLRVGILDLDIFGPSVPTLLGLQDSPEPSLTPCISPPSHPL